MAAAAVPEDAMFLKGLKEVYKFFLRVGAVGDASHDFKGDRAGGGSIFDKIFKTYKDIGAPAGTTAKEDKILSESEVMSLILNYLKPDTKKADEPRAFKSKFLTGTPASPEQVIGTYSRWMGDPYPITVTSLLVAKKEMGQYKWTRTAQQLYDFMNPTGADEVAFTIDAADVPFYDLFMEEELAGDGGVSKKLYYLETREGISDAASKVALTPPKPKKGEAQKRLAVEIITTQDIAQSTAVYPAFDTAAAAAGKVEPLASFFSDYNLSLSPIGMSAAGIPSTTLSFVGAGLDQKIQLLRTNTEDSHPNSVPALAARIKGFLSRLFGGASAAAPAPEDRTKYHVSLQQKRSGDWLQVLSCLQPERFGLKPTTRITMVTLDKICLAYAMFMGVDAILTYKDEKKNKWLVRFNRSGGPPASELELFTKSAKSLPEPSFRLGAGDDTKLYTVIKKLYMEVLEEEETKINTAFESQILNTNREVENKKGIDVDKAVKNILKAAMNLAVFKTLCPKMQGTAAAEEVNELKPYRTDEGSAEDRERGLTAARNAYKIYRENYLILNVALKAVREKTDAGIKASFKEYIGRMQVLKGRGAEGREAADVYELIDRLKIVSGFLFRKGNGGANGTGIFSYIGTVLNRRALYSILESIIKLGALIEDSGKLERYGEFVKTIRLLIGDGEPEPPSVEYVTNEELVGTMEEAVGAAASTAVPFGREEIVPNVSVGGTRSKIYTGSKIYKRSKWAVGRTLGASSRGSKIIRQPRPTFSRAIQSRVQQSKTRRLATIMENSAESRSRATMKSAGSAASARASAALPGVWTGDVRISDYGAALSILAARFQGDISRVGAAGIELRADLFRNAGVKDWNQGGGVRPKLARRGKGAVGTSESQRQLKRAAEAEKIRREKRDEEQKARRTAPFEHNPFATFYLFIKEVAFRLQYTEDGDSIRAYHFLINNITAAVNSLYRELFSEGKVPTNSELLQMYIYEIQLLQGKLLYRVGIDQRIVKSLCKDVLASYYGIIAMPAIGEYEEYLLNLSRARGIDNAALFYKADIMKLGAYILSIIPSLTERMPLPPKRATLKRRSERTQLRALSLLFASTRSARSKSSAPFPLK